MLSVHGSLKPRLTSAAPSGGGAHLLTGLQEPHPGVDRMLLVAGLGCVDGRGDPWGRLGIRVGGRLERSSDKMSNGPQERYSHLDENSVNRH